MATVHGKEGSLTFATGSDAEITAWEATFTVDTHEVQTFSSAASDADNKQRIGGLKDCTGSFSGFISGAEIPVAPTGTPEAVTLLSDTGDSITGSIIINTLVLGVKVEDVQEMSGTFEQASAMTIGGWA